jgi:hypothetical protein
VPYAFVHVETYKHSNSKLRSRVTDTTNVDGYFDLLYGYRQGDKVKISIESDSGSLYEDLVQGTREFQVK